MSYLDSLYLDSFQTTKSHSYDSYSIYIAIFSSFLQGVYPVGVTDLRPYFTQIIGNNSVNVHRIPTKLGTKIRLNEPFKYTNFQCKVCENKKFGLCNSEVAGAIFFKCGMWTPLPSGHVCRNFGFDQIRDHAATKV